MIASAIWIINSIALFIQPFLPFTPAQLMGWIMGFFFVLSYWIVFPICILVSLIALIKKRGSCINNLGTLILSLPPVCYIIYLAIQLSSQQRGL